MDPVPIGHGMPHLSVDSTCGWEGYDLHKLLPQDTPWERHLTSEGKFAAIGEPKRVDAGFGRSTEVEIKGLGSG